MINPLGPSSRDQLRRFSGDHLRGRIRRPGDDAGHGGRVTDPADTVGSNNYQLPIAKMANWIATRGYTS